MNRGVFGGSGAAELGQLSANLSANINTLQAVAAYSIHDLDSIGGGVIELEPDVEKFGANTTSLGLLNIGEVYSETPSVWEIETNAKHASFEVFGVGVENSLEILPFFDHTLLVGQNVEVLPQVSAEKHNSKSAVSNIARLPESTYLSDLGGTLDGVIVDEDALSLRDGYEDNDTYEDRIFGIRYNLTLEDFLDDDDFFGIEDEGFEKYDLMYDVPFGPEKYSDFLEDVRVSPEQGWGRGVKGRTNLIVENDLGLEVEKLAGLEERIGLSSGSKAFLSDYLKHVEGELVRMGSAAEGTLQSDILSDTELGPTALQILESNNDSLEKNENYSNDTIKQTMVTEYRTKDSKYYNQEFSNDETNMFLENIELGAVSGIYAARPSNESVYFEDLEFLALQDAHEGDWNRLGLLTQNPKRTQTVST